MERKLASAREPYADRFAAGDELARLLHGHRGPSLVILALPGGGIMVALPVSRALKAPIYPLLIGKFAVPWLPEVALGAVDLDGVITTAEQTLRQFHFTPAELTRLASLAHKELLLREASYGHPRPDEHLDGASALLIDDAMFAGLSMQAAARFARRHGAKTTTAAVPCSSTTATRRLRGEVDALVCPWVLPELSDLRQVYHRQEPLPDERLQRLLSERHERVH